MNCACGSPLHYNSNEVEEVVVKLVESQGEYVTVTTSDGSFLVQRHYIALHGLEAANLLELEKQGIVQRKS